MMRIEGRSVRTLLAGTALAIGMAFGPATASDDPLLSGITGFKQAVATSAGRLDGERGDAIAQFYRERSFAPLWTTGDEAGRARLGALMAAMSRAANHGLPADRYDPMQLRSQVVSARGPSEIGRLEIEITRLYLDYANALSSGLVSPRRIDPKVMVRDVIARDPLDLLRAMDGGDPVEVLRGLAPRSHEYVRLMGHKKRLETALRRGGWGAQVPGGKLEPGDSGPAVIALRDRLRAMGVMGRSVSPRYDAGLTAAVRRFQEQIGLDADGVAGPATLEAINVSAEDRLGSVLVAMERERWMNAHHREGRMIWVNLPEFRTRIIDDGRTVFTTRAVVGSRTDGKETPEFSDEMEFMVINPSWYVPPGIIRRSYLPKLQANPYALGHLDIVDRRGRPANRAAGFGGYSARNFPFSIRQRPGPNNALGLVKFMFPNKHAIYLHDTPDKHLFQRDVRDYSSGCVRLADPFEFAYALLARQTDDPKGLFHSILNTGAERRVNLDDSVPVHIVYRTAFTDARGGLHFRDDLYGRDAKVLAALRAAGVEVGPVRLAGDLAGGGSDG